jgi:glutathione peroxidase
MKIKFTLLLCLGFFINAHAQLQTFYDFSWPTINGDTISMSQYAGKKVMVVNVASYCTYTREFAPLSRLDSIYSARYNFAVIGFPCNDFANQGGSDSAVIATCHTYDVQFQIMSRVNIISRDTAPLYKWLQRGDLNGVQSDHVTWNFNKFLIDRQGHWVRWFDSPVDPLDTAITNWIVEDSASVSTGVSILGAPGDLIALKSANPATATIDIEVQTALAQKMTINLYTLDGRLAANIYSGNVSHSQLISYPALGLANGIYVIRAVSDGYERTLKCVIQR